MFTALAIITLFKYKIRIHYAFKNEQIPSTIILLLQFLVVITVFGVILLAVLTADENISDLGSKVINIVLQTLFLLSLSGLNFFTTKQLTKKFDLHNQDEISSKLFYLEVLI